MNNKIYLDISSILKDEILSMSEKNVTPLSWSEFIKIENDVKGILNDIIKENINNKAISDLLLINYKLFIDLSNLIFNHVVICQSDNEVIYSPNSKYYNFFEEKGIPGRPIIEPLNINQPTLKRKIKNRLKLVKLFLKANKLKDILHFSKVDYMLFESDSKYTLEYLKNRNSLIIPISLTQIINRKEKKREISEKDSELSNYLSQIIVNKYKELLSKYKIVYNEQISHYIVNFLKAIFENSIFYSNIFDEYLKNQKPWNLFIGSNNNMLLRSFSVLVRKYGGKVSAFTHGEPLIYDWDKISWMELALVDEYFEYSKGLADSLKEMIKINPPVNNNKVKVSSFNTKYFRNTFQNLKKTYPSNSIMFVTNEFVREGQLSQVSSFPNSIQFDFETRLMKHLSKKFDKVYYKKHPGGVLQKEQIKFFPDNVEIIDEPFESVLNLTNNIIFGHSRTTAIGPALASDKNIILLNGEWENIEESLLKTLKKQVFILNYTEVDHRLMINFEELDQLINSDESKDLSFYENYLKI